MATAAFRQTTTVAHSPSDCLHDVIDEVWVVALAVDLGRFFHVLSTVLCVLCRAPSGHPVLQCFLPLGRSPLEVYAWRYRDCGCRSFGCSSARSSRFGSRRSCACRPPRESGALARGGRGTRVPRVFLLCCCFFRFLGRSLVRYSLLSLFYSLR